MDRTPHPRSPEALARQLQECSAGLNAARSAPEPQAGSTVPVLGALFAFFRRVANRLATRWYVAPIVAQQERFNAQVTAAYDELAAASTDHQWRLAEVERRLQDLAPPPAGDGAQPGECAGDDIAALLRLPPEALQARENADLPPGLDSRHEREVAEIHDVALSIRHPLSWKQADFGWHYLFNMAVLGPMLNGRPGDLVLDFAGGSGWVSEFLNRFGMRTILLDYGEPVLRNSRQRFAADCRLEADFPILPVCGDGMRLPLADESLDGIVCMNALHHMPSYEATLREMARVLKPGCRAVFGEPGESHAATPRSQAAMREHGVYEKNVSLDLVYCYAQRCGFARMWRYPYLYPPQMELSFPEAGRTPAGVLEHLRAALPDGLANLALFALQKEGARPVDSNAPPAEWVRHGLQGEITLLHSTATAPTGSTLVDRVRVRNTGGVTWLAAARPLGGYVQLGLKLCDEQGHVLSDTLPRPALPGDLLPGDEAELDVPIQAPATPGTYLLKYDLVNEWRSWFEVLGSRPVLRELVVTPE